MKAEAHVGGILHALILHARGVKTFSGYAMLENRKGAQVMARKPKYESVEQIEGLIEAYFESCKGEILRDEDGRIVFNQKDGTPVWVGRKPPTIPGLALALGFSSRQSLYNYKARKEFMDTISRAQTRVEQYTAERLFDRDSQRGAQFALEYAFRYRRDAGDEKQDQTPRVLLECDAEDASE